MDDRPEMRASDADRDAVVQRLRVALEEGRLKTDEYMARMERAYHAVTYGDLAPLHADLPESTAVAGREPAAPAAPNAAPRAAAAARPPAARNGVAGLPTPLKVAWTAWLVVVSINIVIWVLVMGTSGHLVYPWPVWVAGPWGAALAAISVGSTQFRRGHRTAPERLPRGEG